MFTFCSMRHRPQHVNGCRYPAASRLSLLQMPPRPHAPTLSPARGREGRFVSQVALCLICRAFPFRIPKRVIPYIFTFLQHVNANGGPLGSRLFVVQVDRPFTASPAEPPFCVWGRPVCPSDLMPSFPSCGSEALALFQCSDRAVTAFFDIVISLRLSS